MKSTLFRNIGLVALFLLSLLGSAAATSNTLVVRNFYRRTLSGNLQILTSANTGQGVWLFPTYPPGGDTTGFGKPFSYLGVANAYNWGVYPDSSALFNVVLRGIPDSVLYTNQWIQTEHAGASFVNHSWQMAAAVVDTPRIAAGAVPLLRLLIPAGAITGRPLIVQGGQLGCGPFNFALDAQHRFAPGVSVKADTFFTNNLRPQSGGTIAAGTNSFSADNFNFPSGGGIGTLGTQIYAFYCQGDSTIVYDQSNTVPTLSIYQHYGTLFAHAYGTWLFNGTLSISGTIQADSNRWATGTLSLKDAKVGGTKARYQVMASTGTGAGAGAWQNDDSLLVKAATLAPTALKTTAALAKGAVLAGTGTGAATWVLALDTTVTCSPGIGKTRTKFIHYGVSSGWMGWNALRNTGTHISTWTPSNHQYSFEFIPPDTVNMFCTTTGATDTESVKLYAPH